MKEKLKNSLVSLNTALEELSQNISAHDSMLAKQYAENINRYKDELAGSLSHNREQETEIKKLNDTIIVQRDKLDHAQTKVKDLIVTLKNKMEQL